MPHLARTVTLITASLIAVAAGSALAGPGAGRDTPAAQSSHARAARVLAESLALQPGDAALIDAALTHPLEFTAVPGEREFTGELIVHARKNRVGRAQGRVAALTRRTSAFVPESVVRVPAGLTEGQMAAVLMATGDYEFVEPNWLLYPAVVPNDPQYGSSWQHTRLDSDEAWDLHTGDSQVIVAVCDSGVDLDHPDLQDALVPGYNAASSRPQSTGGQVDDINGHGTFVAGCAAARGNNGTGVVGVGWNLSIMPVRVTNNNNGTANGFDILDGARWAAEHGARVVNASFSGGTSSANQTTARYLKTRGALLFWAAGNDSAYITPDLPDLVTVASTTQSDGRSGFSNYGPAVDVAAPGSSVRSTQRFGGYGNSSGTSFASPIAAGVGAMIFSVNPDFSADDVQDILYHSVDDLGATGRDDSFGRGRVNTHSAVVMALGYVRPLLTPIGESFEDSGWQGLLTVTSGAVETQAAAGAPDGSSVLVLDESDSIETVALAGRSLAGDAVLSFDLRATGIEAGESLTVQYLENPDTSAPGTWSTLTQISGQGRTGDEFVHYDLALPNGYEWHGVKVRFVASGDDSSDIWELDALTIDELGEPVAPLVEDFETGVLSPTRWSGDDSTTIGFSQNTFHATLGDGARLTSRDIPMFQFGIVPAYIRFDAWADASVASSDTLVVEVYNIGDVWETVATIHGSDLTTSPQLVQLDMPITAIALDDLKLRFTAATGGSLSIDDVYVGVDPLTAGCGGADLAEPLGELNFFDISAFLGAFGAHEPAADINGDGQFSFFDVSAFLTEFNAGCP